jgi:hypothetical protein
VWIQIPPSRCGEGAGGCCKGTSKVCKKYILFRCMHNVLERQPHFVKNHLLFVKLATIYLAENLLLALKFSP